MKKTALIVTILSFLGTLAYAGSAEVSAKEMKQVAPAPAPGCFDWSGLYIGGFGGYKFSSVDLNLNLNGDWNFFPDAQHRGESAGSGDLDNSGGELGALLGYNWQFGCWVVGVEAAGGYLWARDSSDSGPIFTDEEPFDFHIRSSFKTNFLFTLAPRFGYAFGNWLPYVTGGLAVGDLDFEQTIDPFVSVAPSTGHDKELKAGWMVGGGLQYALTTRWSVRVQYQFIDLGSLDFNSNFRDEFSDFPANHEVQLREHNASFAIMYKF